MSLDTRVRAANSDAARAEADAELVSFVAQHHRRLIRLAAVVCRNTSDAEDAVQAALERAWRGRSTLRDPTVLKVWLDRIVVREAIRTGRSRRLFGLLGSVTQISVEPIDPSARPAALAQQRADLQTAWLALPVAQRAIVALHLYAGYTVAEAADMVGVPVETARSRLRLARERLRVHLGEGPA